MRGMPMAYWRTYGTKRTSSSAQHAHLDHGGGEFNRRDRRRHWHHGETDAQGSIPDVI